ncbi:molybdenum cofactor biosynthesis protein [Desulfonema ishimotonii]|uniref:Molybdenum cofactor biosynthesis protein B n=1 Tax=Desulfonema ishimotonii TaxID=45657 RepID=A0A401FYC7_9BACT|nr:molybdenum cofactor biosynthesis protein B [Desulfonema ishimotonii]GBC62012.1 molybdenum cofactor biosynthesis protein [Desulfonema ishimotonii]
MGVEDHKKHAVKSVRAGVITLSSTRSKAEDESGTWIAEQLRQQGHTLVFHQVLPDNGAIITQTVLNAIYEQTPHVLLLNGGTGASPRDVTVEAVRSLFQKELTAFSTLFAQLSFEEIGAAAILSRATAGVIRRTAVFCMPGSIRACKLACTRLIFPELGHLAKHLSEE